MRRKERTALDPVCGRQVSMHSEFRTNFMGDIYCFCSGKDLAEFERDPLKYVSKEKADAAQAGIYIVREEPCAPASRR